jgi:hypothetical protein
MINPATCMKTKAAKISRRPSKRKPFVSEHRRRIEIAAAWKRVADIGPKLDANRLTRIRLLEDARQAVAYATALEKKYA